MQLLPTVRINVVRVLVTGMILTTNVIANLLFADCGYPSVVPTSQWTDFGSNSVTLNGVPAPVGAVVDAFDPQGIHCGQRYVTSSGILNVMSVYGDDTLTVGLDEGCSNGDSVFFRVNGIRALVTSGNSTYGGSLKIIALTSGSPDPGDADGNALITISDAVFLIQYIFSGGPSPTPISRGDANCDESLTVSDAVYLIQYIFAGGPAPCAGC